MSNTTCVMSGLSMGSGPVVFIPLVRPRLRKGTPSDLTGLSEIISMYGPCELFAPLTLPIRGELGDYWRLGAVVEDANTRAIERAFGLPIQDFVNQIREKTFLAPGFLSHTREPFNEPVGGCFVHGRIYDLFSTRFTKSWGADGYTLWHNGGPDDPTLRMMGFEPAGKRRHERYTNKWVHPSYPRVVLWADYGACCILKRPGRRDESPRSPADIAKMLEENGPGFPNDVRQKMLGIPADLIRLDLEIEEIRQNRDMYTKHLKPTGFYTPTEGNHILHTFDPGFPDRFWPELEAGELRAQVVAFSTFLTNMYSCNRLLMPGYTGPSGGNYYAHNELLQATAELVQERLARERPRVEA